MATRVEKPLIVIVGPTASGKSSLAIDIAKHHGGEIICTDSRTVFREMNIGTAKVSIQEQAEVPHWGIDLTNPGERYTAAQFQYYANQKIVEIRDRGSLPIMVGGTGLYIDGVIFDYQYPIEASSEQRQKLEGMSIEELHKYCLDHNIELPYNDKNKRHLIRSIVHKNHKNIRNTSVKLNTYVYGIAVDKSTLKTRISQRTEQMFEDGVVEEARKLGKKYGWESESMSGNIYPLMRDYLAGERTLEEAKASFRDRDWQLAKRQLTWFRRNPFILWGNVEDCQKHISGQLAS